MLRFTCAPSDALATLRAEGLSLAGAYRFYPTVDTALMHRAEGEQVVVVDLSRLDGPTVPVQALVNVVPTYRPPRAVPAAGGYVVRQGAYGVEVLLIFRRGAWDLPKGKLDPGEDLADCALREVGEEVGIEGELTILRPLGPTVHTYDEKGFCCVKTTHWYLMTTAATTFEPETREGIEQAAWVPWPEARRRVDYATLRRHMLVHEAAIREGATAL